MLESSDRDWEFFAQRDPYHAVLTQDKFKQQNLTPEGKAEFWRTGEQYIGRIQSRVQSAFGTALGGGYALDFGCGVGRLVFPLTKIYRNVIGVDVSPSMIREASLEAQRRGITNAQFVNAGDCSALGSESCDLINSVIVFQHIPVNRGYMIFDDMLDKLKPGGIAVVQFTYWNAGRRERSPINSLTEGHAAQTKAQVPVMQMNEYGLNVLFHTLQAKGVSQIFSEFTDHGVKGVVLYFRKPD